MTAIHNCWTCSKDFHGLPVRKHYCSLYCVENSPYATRAKAPGERSEFDAPRVVSLETPAKEHS